MRFTLPWLLLLLLAPGLAQASARFEGSTTVDYDIAWVNDNGFEAVSAWVSVDGIVGEHAGPVTAPPLALVVRLSRSTQPLDPGWDVAWMGLPRLEQGERLEWVQEELIADDLPAGEYWVHLLLVDDRDGYVLDARTEGWSRIWRGGIDLSGRLYVDETDPYAVYVSIPELRNNRLDAHSGSIRLRLYTTLTDGPAGEDATLCSREIRGLQAGEARYDIGLECALNSPLRPTEVLHVEAKAAGQPAADTLTAPASSCCGPSYAGAANPLWLLLILLGRHFLDARARRLARTSPMGAPCASTTPCFSSEPCSLPSVPRPRH